MYFIVYNRKRVGWNPTKKLKEQILCWKNQEIGKLAQRSTIPNAWSLKVVRIHGEGSQNVANTAADIMLTQRIAKTEKNTGKIYSMEQAKMACSFHSTE